MRALTMIALATFFTLTACKEMEKIPGNYDVTTVAGTDYAAYGVTLNIAMGEENKLTGNSGCNQYFTDFTNPESNKVEIGMIAGTKMMCMDKDKIERAYLEQLSNVKSVKPTATGLELMNEAGKVIIVAKRK